jgi:phosphoketolase
MKENTTGTLTPDLLVKMDAYWRAANYLSLGQIFLFDNPELIVACVVGDGEAKTGPLGKVWHSNKFLDRGYRRRGAADPASQRLQDFKPDHPSVYRA